MTCNHFAISKCIEYFNEDHRFILILEFITGSDISCIIEKKNQEIDLEVAKRMEKQSGFFRQARKQDKEKFRSVIREEIF